MKQAKMGKEELDKHLKELARFLYDLYQDKKVRRLVDPEDCKTEINS